MADGFASIEDGVSRIKCPVLIIGVQSDFLVPCHMQREFADLLRKTGKSRFYRLLVPHVNAIYT